MSRPRRAYSCVTRSANDARFHECGDGKTASTLLDREVGVQQEQDVTIGACCIVRQFGVQYNNTIEG
jgi:hypothetical protein